MTPQELGAHRSKICFDVEVIMQGYWQSMPPAEIKTAMLADWADALEDWSHKQVLWALRKWRNENPNKKPNPGHILAMLKDARGRAEAERMRLSKPIPKQEPALAPITEEERAARKAAADEIMDMFRGTRRG